MPRKDTLPVLVFATQNPNKIREIKRALEGRMEVKGLEEFPILEELPETGDTLEKNALQKAKFVSETFKVDCFADDTGLEVLALNGAPGVYSARYAGEEKDAQANIRKLLEEMKDFSDRRARFRTVIALVKDGKEHIFEGEVKGMISYAPMGTEGFGYDPIFRPDGEELSFAQMTLEQKNALSHRARAVNKLVEFLAKA